MRREGSSHQVLSGRMRKRDIVHYYGRRMIRKVRELLVLITAKVIIIMTGWHGVRSSQEAT